MSSANKVYLFGKLPAIVITTKDWFWDDKTIAEI